MARTYGSLEVKSGNMMDHEILQTPLDLGIARHERTKCSHIVQRSKRLRWCRISGTKYIQKLYEQGRGTHERRMLFTRVRMRDKQNGTRHGRGDILVSICITWSARVSGASRKIDSIDARGPGRTRRDQMSIVPDRQG